METSGEKNEGMGDGLNSATNQSTGELASSKKQLQAVGRLAGALAHEIRNPLTAIDMHVALLAESLVEAELTQPQRVERFLSIIRAELHRLTEILDHYSNLTGTQDLHIETVDVNREIQELRELMAPQAEAAGLRFEIQTGSNLGPIQADRTQLRQALLNLVINAFQATDQGGGVEIRVHRLDGPRRIRFEIQDDGAGIDPQDLPRIYELFFTTKASGAGLGLSIVDQIVTDHGGELQVRSRHGEGTTFILDLPVQG